ncbi:MAG: class 1 fructose-bisphosphatase [Deltaproteobacteria bacterium]|nr:class 1 fructose-bisphosphatase [Deltaproteobacteria bacterium]
MAQQQVTVTEHLLWHQIKSPAATGVFTQLLYDLILSAKLISRSVSKAGLLDVLGETGEVNVQGENVQKLDDYADKILIHRMERSGALCLMASEEHADLIRIDPSFTRGDYMLIFDPLDGSSNIDVNVNVGTIFSIHRRADHSGREASLEDILQEGYRQVGAGYFLYGPSCMMVYSTGQGVHGFTLDPSVGEFLLSHPDMQIPRQGNIYSANDGNYTLWDDKARLASDYFKSDRNRTGKPYTLRYVGSLVADFHRTLLYGGVFMYPAVRKPDGRFEGKLRLMCEASPLAFLAEQAGGRATDGQRRILELKPYSLHQRAPLFIGSANDVDDVMQFMS